MEKIGTKIIKTSDGPREFDVYPCNCKVGDTIWFDDGIDENTHNYLTAVVESIDPDHWWIYDDGDKVLGCITAKVTSGYFTGQRFKIDFKDIIYDEPSESIAARLQYELDRAESTLKEFKEMDKDIQFLIDEYKTNKKYFRQEPGRCTVEDVIKTVYEFAWAASKNYFN